MSPRETESKTIESSYEVMDADDASPVLVGTAFTTKEQMEVAFRQVELMSEFKNKVYALLKSEIDPEQDITRFEDNNGIIYRPSWTFADKVIGKLGGEFKFVRDDLGKPIIEKKEFEDVKGKYFSVTMYGTASSKFGATVDVVQVVTSRHKFFGKVDKELRPMEDVSEADIVAACYSMAYKKGILRSYGIPISMTAKDLEKFGIKPEQVKGHKFAKGKQGGSTDNADEKTLRANIETMCRQLFDAGFQVPEVPAHQKPEDVLQHITANLDKGWKGWKSFNAISANQLKGIAEKLLAIKEKFEADQESVAQ